MTTMTLTSLIAVAATFLALINATANAQNATGRFEKEIAAFEATDRVMPSPPGGIVFTKNCKNTFDSANVVRFDAKIVV